MRRCRTLNRLFITGRAAPKHQPGALTVNPVGEKAGRDAARCVPSADKTTRLCGYLYKVMPERRQQMKPTSWKKLTTTFDHWRVKTIGYLVASEKGIFWSSWDISRETSILQLSFRKNMKGNAHFRAWSSWFVLTFGYLDLSTRFFFLRYALAPKIDTTYCNAIQQTKSHVKILFRILRCILTE